MQVVMVKSPGSMLETIKLEEINLDFLQSKVGGCIDIVDLNDNIDMVINDEMLYSGEDPNSSYVNGAGQRLDIFGTVVFTGCDDEGSSVGLSSEQVVKLFTLFK